MIITNQPTDQDQEQQNLLYDLRFSRAMTMKNIVFCYVARRGIVFEPTFRRNVSPPSSGQVKSMRSQVSRWLRTCLPVDSCFAPALNMKAINSSETSIQTRATRRYNPEDDILQQNSFLNFPRRFFWTDILVKNCIYSSVSLVKFIWWNNVIFSTSSIYKQVFSFVLTLHTCIWISLTSCCLSCFKLCIKIETPFNESTRSLKPYEGGTEKRTN
jgi:hypothetical protein